MFNLIVFKGNNKVYNGNESCLMDFFFTYAYLFNALLVRVPFNEFQIGVIWELNVAPTQLHSNN